MDWLEKMNSAIVYIEANLDNEIDINKASKLAGCNAYHFQRVFSYIANTTVAEYIRRRRLTCAAFDLQGSEMKVIDVALKYGYDSPTSFTRAFAALHGITPSQGKKDGTNFIAYPPLSFQIIIKGVSVMNYRIETKEAFRVVGSKITTTFANDQALKDIPEFWDEVCAKDGLQQLCSMMNSQPEGVFGMSIANKENNANNDYYIAVASTLPVNENMQEYLVPAATWAIFEGTGPLPASIQNLQKQIYTQWLPNSGYDYNEKAPDIEVYSDGDQQGSDYKCWVWLPVVKK